jgi:prevent-host-death family protein
MKKANLHEAKTHLSKLIELVIQGEEVVICKAGTPVAKLIAFRQKKETRKPGAWKGKVKIEKDFDELPENFMSFFK